MASNTATLAAITTAFRARTGTPTWGTATFTGDGAEQVFAIAHGSGGTPNNSWVTPMSEAATAARSASATATDLVVTYADAPANGAVLAFRWGCSRL